MGKKALVVTLICLGVCIGEAVALSLNGNQAWILALAGAAVLSYRAIVLARRI